MKKLIIDNTETITLLSQARAAITAATFVRAEASQLFQAARLVSEANQINTTGTNVPLSRARQAIQNALLGSK